MSEQATPHARTPNAIIRDPSIGVNAKALYTLLASYAGPSDCCYPSVVRLAEELGVSVSWVRRALRELETRGLITTTLRQGGSSFYRLHSTVNTPITGDTPITHDSTITHDTPITGDATPITGEGGPLSPVNDEQVQRTSTKNKQRRGVENSSAKSPPTKPKPSPKAPPNPVPTIGDLVIPEVLTDDNFAAVFAKWIDRRSKKKRPSISWREFFQDQLDDLAQHGPVIAAATIRKSLTNDWQGLFADQVARDLAKTTTTNAPRYTTGGGNFV